MSTFYQILKIGRKWKIASPFKSHSHANKQNISLWITAKNGVPNIKQRSFCSSSTSHIHLSSTVNNGIKLQMCPKAKKLVSENKILMHILDFDQNASVGIDDITWLSDTISSINNDKEIWNSEQFKSIVLNEHGNFWQPKNLTSIDEILYPGIWKFPTNSSKMCDIINKKFITLYENVWGIRLNDQNPSWLNKKNFRYLIPIIFNNVTKTCVKHVIESPQWLQHRQIVNPRLDKHVLLLQDPWLWINLQKHHHDDHGKDAYGFIDKFLRYCCQHFEVIVTSKNASSNHHRQIYQWNQLLCQYDKNNQSWNRINCYIYKNQMDCHFNQWIKEWCAFNKDNNFLTIKLENSINAASGERMRMSYYDDCVNHMIQVPKLNGRLMHCSEMNDFFVNLCDYLEKWKMQTDNGNISTELFLKQNRPDWQTRYCNNLGCSTTRIVSSSSSTEQAESFNEQS